MAVSVVSGPLGGGKSLDCVRMMRDHLAKGGCVATNISLDYKQISKVLHRHLYSWQIVPLSPESDPKTIPIGDRRGHGSRRVLVVLDEALNWFESQANPKDDIKKKMGWPEWLRQSDKLGQDVFFICQNFERAVKWIRELAVRSIEIVPTGEVKILFFLRLKWILPFLRRIYVRIERNVRDGSINSANFHMYRPEIWQLYDTSETFGFEAADSAYRVPIAPAFRFPFRYFVLPALLLLGESVFFLLTK